MLNKLPLLLLLLSPFISFADGRKGVYNWPPYTKIEVPDSLKNEDAFFVDNVRTIDFTDAGETKITVFQRIYLNSAKALEDFGERNLYLNNLGKMTMVNARIIKANGEIRELENDEIKETSTREKNRYTTSVFRRIQLIYPDIQVGDVVDFAYRVEIGRYIISDLLYLEDEIPSLYSRITLRNFSLLDLTAYSLNKMPKAVQRSEGGAPILSWEKRGVPAIELDYFNALPPDAPSSVFVLWRRGQTLDYYTFYVFDQHDYSIRFGAGDVMTKYLVDNGIIQQEDETFVALKKMMQHLEKEFTWDPYVSYDPLKTSNALSDKMLNETLFIRYVAKFLSERKVRFEHSFTKSLLNGRFEHGLVSIEQLANRYLLIYDSQEQIHFLFPPDGKDCFSYIDEIPAYLEGNQSVTLYGAKDFLEEIGAVDLPQSDEKSNTHYANVLLAVSGTDSLRVGVKRKDTFKGQFSPLMRGCHKMDWLEEYNVIEDSLEISPTRVDPFYPYEVEYNQEKIDTACFEQLGSGQWWFKLDHILPEGIYQKGELDEEYGNYVILPFLKTNSISIFLQSDEPLKLLDEMRNFNVENSVGTLKLTASQLMDNVVKIQVEIIVKKRFLENELDVEEYRVFMRRYQDFRAKRWVLQKGAS